MRKIITPVLLSMLVLAASPAAMVQGKQIPAKKYSSCAALRKDFPKGLAFSTLFVEATGATVNAKAYNLNWKALGGLAGDDGIICERVAKK
jgi:hypothetical protein